MKNLAINQKNNEILVKKREEIKIEKNIAYEINLQIIKLEEEGRIIKEIEQKNIQEIKRNFEVEKFLERLNREKSEQDRLKRQRKEEAKNLINKEQRLLANWRNRQEFQKGIERRRQQSNKIQEEIKKQEEERFNKSVEESMRRQLKEEENLRKRREKRQKNEERKGQELERKRL